MKRNTFVLSGLALAVAILGSLYLGNSPSTRNLAPAEETSLASSTGKEAKVLRPADFSSPLHMESAPKQPAPGEEGRIAPTEMTTESGIVDLQSLDSEQLLRLIEESEDREITHQAIDTLLNLLRNEMRENRAAAYATLLRVKDMAQGEDRQSVFKELASFADLGGNEVIVKAVLLDESLSSSEQVRLLTYVDHRYPLPAETADLLIRAYDNVDDILRPLIVRTLAMAGDVAGVSWVVDRTNNSSSFGEWQFMIETLAVSQSKNAFDYLQGQLNSMASDAPKYEEHMAVIRQALSMFDATVRE